MFSSVFDKIVSTTAHDALATFPPRAALPVSSSTLCCLTFADWFIHHYPTAHVSTSCDELGGIDVHAVNSADTGGIAVSAEELDSIMQGAAELGGRLAGALAGKTRSKKRPLATVSNLLGKFRGIFGYRLHCVGREIRVPRDVNAEKEETLLLRQIHALKNAALEACDGDKWCIVVSSGDESLAVCTVPLPLVEEGAAPSCDFLVFDPWPRPAMKLRGSYVVRFTTVRGLQLHLLSALGEIWREREAQRKEGVEKALISLCVVTVSQKQGGGHIDQQRRHLLEESVTRLRRAEKAAAIRHKRQEVENLRKALRCNGNSHPTMAEPPSKEIEQEHLQRESSATDTTDELLEGYRLNKGIEQDEVKLPGRDKKMKETEPATRSPRSLPQHREGGAARSKPDSCVTFPHEQLPLRPPIADVSPPLSVQRSGSRDRKGVCHVGELGSQQRGGDCEAHGVAEEGLTAEVNPKGRRRKTSFKGTYMKDGTCPVDKSGDGGEHSNQAMHLPVPSRNDDVTPEDPLNRALLRSINDEELAEYSKRAYNVYRLHGVIRDGGLQNDAMADPVRSVSVSTDSYAFRPAAASYTTRAGETFVPVASDSRALTVDDGARVDRECRSTIAETPTSVHPFSPLSSPPLHATLSEIASLREERAIAHSVRNDDLKVVDVSDAERAATCATMDPAELEVGTVFRSQLRAPRAGRASSLALANARRGLGRRRAISPTFRRDSSGNPLPPPPPIIETAMSCTKEAWNDRKDRCASELSFTHESDSRDEIMSDKDGSPGHAQMTAAPNTCSDGDESVPCECESDHWTEIKRHPVRTAGSMHREVAEIERQGQEVGRDSSPGKQLLTTHIEERGTPERQSEQHAKDEQHVGDTIARQGDDSFVTNGQCIHINAPASGPSRRLKRRRPTSTGSTTERDYVSEHGSRSSDPLDCKFGPVTPPLNLFFTHAGRQERPHREGREFVNRRLTVLNAKASASDKEHGDHKDFVWFGYPDTPPPREPDTSDACGKADGRAVCDEGIPISLHLQQKRSQAQLLLQMEIRRQRDSIERAAQAREEEGRLRRARIKAEVFKRIQILRRRDVTYLDAISTPSGCSLVNVPPRSPRPPQRAVHAGSSQAPRDFTVLDMDTIAFPGKAGGDATSASFRPDDPQVFGPVRHIPSGLAANGEPQSKLTPGKVVDMMVSTRPRESFSGTVLDKQGRSVGPSRCIVGGVPRMKAPPPPSISFDVEADGFVDGEADLGGAKEGERHARRQRKYQALREKKLAEAEERRRTQKERQAASKAQQRKIKIDAVGTAATATIAMRQTSKRDAGQETYEQGIVEQICPIVNTDIPSANAWSAPVEAIAQPWSSSAQKVAISSAVKINGDKLSAGDDSRGGRMTRAGGNSSIADGSAARLASPVVRGFSRRSNRKLVRNALNFLCLAGGHLQEKKERALETLDSHPASNFVVLLAHTKLLAFKGLYACGGDDGSDAVRVFGLGPLRLDAPMVSGFYKYNSAAREFREVHSKTLGKTTDAVSMEPSRLRRPKSSAVQPAP